MECGEKKKVKFTETVESSSKLLPGAGGGGKRQRLVEGYRYEMKEV